MKKIKQIIVSIIAVFTLNSCSESLNKKELVNNLVFSSVDELSKKYGEALVNPYDNSITIKLKEEINCMVFYKDSTLEIPEVVRIKGANFDPELFYYDLDWDLPKLNWEKSIGKMTVTELYGIENAVYSNNTLNITLNSPQKSTFGKRLK